MSREDVLTPAAQDGRPACRVADLRAVSKSKASDTHFRCEPKKIKFGQTDLAQEPEGGFGGAPGAELSS
jgi:hypothetical protein